LPSSIHSTVYRELIEFLIEARNTAGLTQQAVADSLGRQQYYVAKVEGFERRLDLVEYLEFANAVGVSPISAIKAAWVQVSGK